MQKCNQKTPRKKAARNERRKATSTKAAAAGSSGRGKIERKGGRGREAEAQANCKRCTILAPQVLIKCCSQVSVTHADIALDVAEGVWEGKGRPGGRQRGGVAAADTHILRQHLRIQCENELQPNVAR